MLAGLSACNKPRCTELSRQAVEDDERTPAGSVEALMEAVSLDGEHPAVWWDGESTLATLRISRGQAGAVWVEQEERENRLLEPWTNDLAVFCPNYLSVPLQVEISAGEDLDLNMNGQAVRWEGDVEEELYRVSASAPYTAGLLPETDQDPAEYSDKSIDFSALLGDGEIHWGWLGWNGQRELEDGAVVYRSEMVLEFEEVME
jgi:hypothetical protein